MMAGGAVEIIIWQLKINLEKTGNEVKILNKRGLINALLTKPWLYDVVHLEYEDLSMLWIKLSKIFKFNLVITSHYGYAAWPEKWNRGYKKIFKTILNSRNLLTLSEDIKNVYAENGYKGKLYTLPNGTDTKNIVFNDTSQVNKDVICIGKIEPRKKQTIISDIFKDSDIKIDFVGPIVDKAFSVNNKNINYLGSWTRDQVNQKLTHYKSLILLSDGEAHALVVGEALAAGLSLIISKEASANLNTNLPFINIIDINDNRQEIINNVREICYKNYLHRKSIRDYATENFDWSKIVEKYIKILKSIKKQ